MFHVISIFVTGLPVTIFIKYGTFKKYTEYPGEKKNHWNPDENFDFYYSHWSPCHQVILLESAQEYPFWKGQSTSDDLKKKKKVKFLFPLLLDFHISCPLI